MTKTTAAIVALAAVACGAPLASCGRVASHELEPPSTGSASPASDVATPVSSVSVPAPLPAPLRPHDEQAPATEPPPKPVTRTSHGSCVPMPKQGDACAPGESYCVIDWGQPGGHSRALWCRGGRWQMEEEVNLP